MTNYKVCCLTFKLFQKEVELLQAPYGAPAGTRTQDSRLKRAVLYQLSYRRKYAARLF